MAFNRDAFPDVNWYSMAIRAQRLLRACDVWLKEGGEWREFDRPFEKLSEEAMMVHNIAFIMLRSLDLADRLGHCPERSLVALAVALAECIAEDVDENGFVG